MLPLPDDYRSGFGGFFFLFFCSFLLPLLALSLLFNFPNFPAIGEGHHLYHSHDGRFVVWDSLRECFFFSILYPPLGFFTTGLSA